MKSFLQININLLRRKYYLLASNYSKELFISASFAIFIIFLTSTIISFAQEPLSGKETISKGQHLQSDLLNNYGTLWGWGGNSKGEIGNGTNENVKYPLQIGKDYNWKVVTTGMNYTIAIKNDGSLWGWGSNFVGELGNGSLNSINVPQKSGNVNDWKYVASGMRHSLAIREDGTLWSWGYNEPKGILGDSTVPDLESVISPIRIEKTWNDVSYVDASSNISCAMRAGGTLYFWGSNILGQLGDGTNISKKHPAKIGNEGEWLKVSCEYGHSLAIKKDGTLWAWGRNNYGELGDGTTINKKSPVQIGSENDWKFVYSTVNRSYAIKKNGTLWAWGDNQVIPLGDSTIVSAKVLAPIKIGKDNDWESISGLGYHMVGIKIDGTLWTWGGQMFDVPDQIFKVPTKLKNFNDVCMISNKPESYHTMFIKRHIPSLPEVVTLPIINVSDSTAESGGNVTNDGKEWDCVRGICWAETPNPTINDSITVDGHGVGEYQSTMKFLKPFTKYYVRAFVTNSVGTAYGQEETFGSKLPSPILLFPKNGNYNIPLDVSLLWKKVTLAQKYRVQIYSSSKIISDEITSDTSYKFDKYETMNQYDWRVQSINGSDSSYWSDMWNFTTSKFYPAQLLKPGRDTINIPIDCVLSWKENIAGCKYNMQLSKNINFTNSETDTTISETNFKLSKLDYLQLYNWRIRAIEGVDSSDWSPVWKFSTLMDSVNLTSPTDLSKNQNLPVNMSWAEGIYKKDYRLQISVTNDFATTNTDTLISKTVNADVKNLNNCQKYFWRVRNESGDTLGYWSEIWQFKTRMSDMLLMYPENTQTGLAQEINFKWYPVIGAEYYQLQISKNDQFTNMVYSKDSITATEKLVPDLEKDILYYWRVRVWNTESIGTAYWSEVWTFRTGETSVQDESEYFQIVPNPASDNVVIKVNLIEEGQSTLSIINSNGMKIKEINITGETGLRLINLNAREFANGLYFFQLQTPTVVENKKLMIVK
ncbi:MAG: T9SS type A sorting domain-containing protein [bacterium]